MMVRLMLDPILTRPPSRSPSYLSYSWFWDIHSWESTTPSLIDPPARCMLGTTIAGMTACSTPPTEGTSQSQYRNILVTRMLSQLVRGVQKIQKSYIAALFTRRPRETSKFSRNRRFSSCSWRSVLYEEMDESIFQTSSMPFPEFIVKRGILQVIRLKLHLWRIGRLWTP